MSDMKDQKYQKRQKRKFQIIMKEHAIPSLVIAVIFVFLVFLSAGYEHPDDWKEVTITLDRYETVFLKKGHRLDVYDTNGNCYSFNRNKGNIKKQLVVGKEYTFTYSDNFFHDIVEQIEIDGIEYLTHEEAIKNYRGTKIVLDTLSFIALIGLLAGNIFLYRMSTRHKIRIYCYHKKADKGKERKDFSSKNA